MNHTYPGILSILLLIAGAGCRSNDAVTAEDSDASLADNKIEEVRDENGNLTESLEALPPRNGKFRGVMRHYYTNGNLKAEIGIIEAAGELGYAPDGIVKTYYDNTQLRSSLRYEDEKLNGRFKYYYRNGNPRESGKFVDGRTATARRWDRRGQRLSSKEHTHVEVASPQAAPAEGTLVYIDNLYDGTIHLGWVFADKRITNQWERIVQHGQGDTMAPRETKRVTYKEGKLDAGKWRIVVSYSELGPAKRRRNITVHSKPFTVAPSAKPVGNASRGK